MPFANLDSRQIKMTIDLGGEQVAVERVEYIETLGKPFSLLVDILATLGDIDLLPHLGKPVAIRVTAEGEQQRHFHGLITEAEYIDDTPVGVQYRLTAHPFAQFLAQNREMAIYQEKSVDQILKLVLEKQPVDYAGLKRTYAKRIYCVQYRESDWAFISRLMEEEGIYYYWRHDESGHTMVLCDEPSVHQPGTPASLIYNPDLSSEMASGNHLVAYENHLFRWHERLSTSGHGKVTLRDFDLVKPERPLQSVSSDEMVHPLDEIEIYDYPANFTEEKVGTDRGKVRLETMRRDRRRYAGESASVGLACGALMTVERHPVERLNAEYLIVGVYHSITAELYRSGQTDGGEPPVIRIDAIPATTPFRSRRTTGKPMVDGLETAVVSGPEGEEIFTDEYGRVKVRFHWDRSKTKGEESTCWIRVAQFGGLGNIVLPRVGQEVMIDFLHGDPDQPVVIGWVFNNQLKPVYPLPANKTRAVWRTKTYGQTGAYPNAKDLDTKKPGANEIRFEDKGGAEEFFMHAERDMNTRVRFEETRHVGASQHVQVGWNRTDLVGNDETTDIKANQKLTVVGNQTEEIQSNRKVDVTATDKLTVGQTIEVTAGQKITIKCGASSIVLDPASITIKSPTIKIEADALLQQKAPMTKIDGSGMLILTGGVVMIN